MSTARSAPTTVDKKHVGKQPKVASLSSISHGIPGDDAAGGAHTSPEAKTASTSSAAISEPALALASVGLAPTPLPASPRAARPTRESGAPTRLASDGSVRLDPATPSVRDDRPYLAVGTAGDHPLVHPFLMTVFQGPTHDAFLASLDDPFYEPRDRLVVKFGERILSHLLLSSRSMGFGPRQLPVSLLSRLGTLPEFRGQGLAQRLLAEADRAMRADGATIGVLSTRIPHFFRTAGWAMCGRHSFSRAGARELLAELRETEVPDLLNPDTPLSIRPWRQVELPSVMRLYRQQVAGAYGALERTEPYWRWLVSRKAYDQLFVAIDGPDRFELDDGTAPIVGYCVTREDQILELAADPRQPRVARQLLARACGEAIERDHHAVTLHAPPCDGLHDVFRRAGGERFHREVHQGLLHMVRLFDPWAFLRDLTDQMHLRAEAAALPRPTELGLCVDGQRWLLVVSRRGVKLVEDRTGRSYLSCNEAELTRLLLGHTDVDESLAQGRLEASTRVAVETARVLFPQLPYFRPLLDELEP